MVLPRSDVALPAGDRQLHLTVSLPGRGALLVGPLRMACRTAHAFFMERGSAVLLTQRAPTGAAQGVRALGQGVADRYPFIEDKAFSLPETLVLGHRFQILENAALEVEDIGDAFLLEKGRRFLAANAALLQEADCFSPRRSSRARAA